MAMKIIDIIDMYKAEKIMKKINNSICKKLSRHWKCYIKKEIGVELVIKYESYEDWKEEDLVYILKLIDAVNIKHNLSIYWYRCKHLLEIDCNIR